MPRLVTYTVLVVVLAAGCGRAERPAAALASGNVEEGRKAFIAFRCYSCHEVAGESLPAPSVIPAVYLGGRALTPPSQSRLAQDITFPSSHFAVGYPANQITKDGRSRMPDYSQVLTDQQVAHLSAYLRSKYSLGIPSPTRQ
jgi:mono/diheme cytochrome c family protein